jgi:hypothetical protein
MVIDKTKKAEILFEYGSMSKFLVHFFAGTIVDVVTLENKYKDCRDELIEPHQLETAWDTDADQFLDDGYTREDIKYHDASEASAAIHDEIVEKMACDLTKEFFSDNQEMIPHLIKFIERNDY